MEEIKVGEYVRTREGKIYKTNITMINDTGIKHSPNIIDLIEEGDYVRS